MKVLVELTASPPGWTPHYCVESDVLEKRMTIVEVKQAISEESCEEKARLWLADLGETESEENLEVARSQFLATPSIDLFTLRSTASKPTLSDDVEVEVLFEVLPDEEDDPDYCRTRLREIDQAALNTRLLTAPEPDGTASGKGVVSGRLQRTSRC